LKCKKVKTKLKLKKHDAENIDILQEELFRLSNFSIVEELIFVLNGQI
jgi:hypothetical protein